MSAGLDANLIGPLDRIGAESTDHLCLSGFNHNLVVVSSLDTNDVKQHWDRLKLPGHVRRAGDESAASIASSRTIYHVPIGEGATVESVQEQLAALLRDRQTATVSLNLPTQIPKRQLPTSSKQADHTREQGTPLSEAARPAGGAAKSKEEASVDEPTEDTRSDEREWQDLDKLVDEFDSLDL